MSNGGLLQKAMEQQESQHNNEDIPVIPIAVVSKDDTSNSKDISLKKIFLALGIGGLLPTVVMMWFGVYLIPDVVPVTLVTPLVTSASLVGVWIYLGIGLPAKIKLEGLLELEFLSYQQ